MSTHVDSPVIPGDGEWTASTGVPVSPSLGRNKSPDLSAQKGGNTSLHAPTPLRSPTLKIPRSDGAYGKDKDSRGLSKALSTTPPANVGLDPLSTQIYLRTSSNTEPTIAQRLLSSGRPDSPTTDAVQQQSVESPLKSTNGSVDVFKDRRKGQSFLSRLAIRSAWKRDDDDDSDSELGEMRTDGSNALAMTSVVGAGGGFIPLHKEPPRYIRVRPHNKRARSFNRLFLAQELSGTKPPRDAEPQRREPATVVGTKILRGGPAIWAAEFSVDGRYLAVAGKDQTVRVFAVISTPEERQEQEDEEEAEERQGRNAGERLCAPVFRSKPFRELKGHTGEVLALSWSKNNFLLSSSMDKTVRLWHMSRRECLCVFTHSDLVTSISFHPTDDRFFLAGSLDAQLRLWSIPDKAVAFSAPTNEFITAVAFSPDGKVAICGLLSGHCMFYETEGLKFQSQIHVRSSRGKNAKGSKITGIRTATIPPETGDVKVLISSNDSRVRIYSLKTKMLEVKFKGLENQSSQIHARFSDNAAYIISGSEDRRAYIWDLSHPEAEVKDKQPYECFDAHPEVVTTALMAPTKTRLLLSVSGDPLYDLCNPPPVTLLSLDEKSNSQTGLSDVEQGDNLSTTKKPDENPAYLERSKHFDGNIIITTDRTGTIKVFRQDCAYLKRQQNTFSNKLNGVGRSSSILTRTSGGSRVNSRRGSLNLSHSPAHNQPALDRIISWRQDMDEEGIDVSSRSIRPDRSMSPSKASRSSLNTSAVNLASAARKQPYSTNSLSRSTKATSPTSSIHTNRASFRLDKDREKQGSLQPPTPSFSLISASDSDLHRDDKEEGSFWNLNRWKGGISGLRYSTTASSLGENGTTQNTIGHQRKGSITLAPINKAAARRSLGVNELSRLRAPENANRRRSMGPVLQSVSSALDSRDSSIDSRPGGAGRQSSSKKRTDSGVAQLSAASGDESDSPACRACGSVNLMTSSINGKPGLKCAKCGTVFSD